MYLSTVGTLHNNKPSALMWFLKQHSESVNVLMFYLLSEYLALRTKFTTALIIFSPWNLEAKSKLQLLKFVKVLIPTGNQETSVEHQPLIAVMRTSLCRVYSCHKKCLILLLVELKLVFTSIVLVHISDYAQKPNQAFLCYVHNISAMVCVNNEGCKWLTLTGWSKAQFFSFMPHELIYCSVFDINLFSIYLSEVSYRLLCTSGRYMSAYLG